MTSPISIAPFNRVFATRICRRYRPLASPNRPNATVIGGDRCRARRRLTQRTTICADYMARSTVDSGRGSFAVIEMQDHDHETCRTLRNEFIAAVLALGVVLPQHQSFI